MPNLLPSPANPPTVSAGTQAVPLLVVLSSEALPFQNILGSQFRESEENAGVAENGLRPQRVGSRSQSCEVFRTHFHVDLDSTLPGSFHPFYRYVSTLG